MSKSKQKNVPSQTDHVRNEEVAMESNDALLTDLRGQVAAISKAQAVVADEVKELAKETAKATEDIGRKIDAIQSDTQGAVDAIGEVGGIINRIKECQETIASSVEEQTATTNEIVRNVGEAARGVSELAQSISGVAQAAQSTTEGARDSKQAADVLAKLADELHGAVARLNKN